MTDGAQADVALCAAIARLALSVSAPSSLFLSLSRRLCRCLTSLLDLYSYLLTAIHFHVHLQPPVLPSPLPLAIPPCLMRPVLPPTLLRGAGPLPALQVADGGGAAGVTVVQLVEARREEVPGYGAVLGAGARGLGLYYYASWEVF